MLPARDELTVEAEPDQHGVDPSRLAHLDAHLRRYVDSDCLAGWQLVISRDGRRIHSAAYGRRDKEAGLPVEPDTLWRIYSMTKPITAIVAMQLFEEGAFSLQDEVAKYLPAFADVQVYVDGPPDRPQTRPVVEPMRIWHLLTHTSGLTYGFTRSSPVDEIYLAHGSDLTQPARLDLASLCDLWASLPLLFDPGTSWNYSVSTDVLGRVIEVITGKPLDVAMTERIFAPLGMTQTRWWVDSDDADRLAALYAPDPVTGRATRFDELGAAALARPDWLSGGGGLITTAGDYDRFLRMLASGGSWAGTQLVSARTLRFMTSNHLPGGARLADLARGMFAETAYEGMGFGLGFGVLVDPIAYKIPASAGEFNWGGVASTSFWVDPAEALTLAFYTQLLPSKTYPIRSELRQLLYAALRD